MVSKKVFPYLLISVFYKAILNMLSVWYCLGFFQTTNLNE